MLAKITRNSSPGAKMLDLCHLCYQSIIVQWHRVLNSYAPGLNASLLSCLTWAFHKNKSIHHFCNNANTQSYVLVKFIKHNQNYYLKLDILTSIRGLHQKKLVLSSSGS